MPINITDVSTFTDPITAPAGADPANAASVVEPIQKLSNRTRFLRNKYDVDGHVVLPAPLQYSKRLTAASALALSGTWTRPDFAELLGGSIAAVAGWELTPLLPYHVSIVRARVLVDPAVARTIGDGRVTAFLISRTYGLSFGSPTIDAPVIEASDDDDGTSNLQWITLTPASPVVVSGKLWTVQVQTGSTSSGADKLHACVVEYQATKITEG